MGTDRRLNAPCINDARDQEIVVISKDEINCESALSGKWRGATTGFSLSAYLVITTYADWSFLDRSESELYESIYVGSIQGWTLTGKKCYKISDMCVAFIDFNHGRNAFFVTIVTQNIDKVEFNFIINQILSTFSPSE